MHSQQPPGVVQNWSTLQCSKQNTEQCGYDHAPVTRGRMRAQFLLPHGPRCTQSRRRGGGIVGKNSSRGILLGSPRPWCSPPRPPPPGSRGVGGAFVTVDSSDSSGSEDGGGGVSRIDLAKQGSAFALGPRVGAPAPRYKFQGRRRQGVTWGGGRTHARCSKHGGGPLEWLAVPCVYRRARLARCWRWVLQRRGEGLMPAGAVWLVPLEWPEPVPRLERQRSVGNWSKVAQETGPPAPSLADSARLAARSRGLVRPPPPPRDPITQPELWDGGGWGFGRPPVFGVP